MCLEFVTRVTKLSFLVISGILNTQGDYMMLALKDPYLMNRCTAIDFSAWDMWWGHTDKKCWKNV